MTANSIEQQLQADISSMIVWKKESGEENLFSLGLDSLKVMRIAGLWRKRGYLITFSELMRSPYFFSWIETIAARKKEEAELYKEENEQKISDEQFPLTDIQYAYWIGRKSEQVLGGVGCHAYLEFDGRGILPERLEHAWKILQQHHSMLRAQFLENGQQKIMPVPYKKELVIHDFRQFSGDELFHELKDIRNTLSHRRLRVEIGEVAGLELSLLPDNFTRLHLDVDLLVADVKSLQIIIRDLAAIYSRGARPAAPQDWDFRIYLDETRQRQLEEQKEAAQYWKKRLSNLPMAPELPLKKRPENVSLPVFKRREHRLPIDDWRKIKEYAANYGLTSAMVLMAGYAVVLDRWSNNSRFLINIPLFDRSNEQEGIDDVVADFSNLLLLAVDCTQQQSFSQQAQAIQKQFLQDMECASYSGVQVQRELARLYEGQRSFAPVVFACNLGMPLVNRECKDVFGKLGYMVSQTPQVWLDFQIYEEEEALLLCWDAVDELFPEGLIDEMSTAYIDLLKRLAGTSDWNIDFPLLSSVQERGWQESCNERIPDEHLQCVHSAFFEYAQSSPDKIALIDSVNDNYVSYGELSKQVLKIAALLKREGVKYGDPVAITLPRGTCQIAGVFAIISLGASYVPIGIDQPPERQEQIHKKANVHFILSDDITSKEARWSKDICIIDIDQSLDIAPLRERPDVSPFDLAYIIFTSGSTGVPKGVEISHYSAWNTIQDVNSRWHVNSTDKCLAVSSLDFDLSVYDIFGLLGAGGSIVLLSEENRRDAICWFQLIEKYQITLWNSVPKLFEMLLAAAQQRPLSFLRLVLLSGDWIPLDIPERLFEISSDCHLVALGGATEASIWSNFFEISIPLPKEWNSIPYGKPLTNQLFRVVDDKGRDCHCWVSGELWIGGLGVAKRYCNEPELTKKSFEEYLGNRWYKTGDFGRYLDDGNIEFLGRKDQQVKIKGHRIELNEIENVLKQSRFVKDAVVVIKKGFQENKQLIGYVVPQLEENEKESISPERESAQWKDFEHINFSRIVMDNVETLSEDFSLFWQQVEDLSLMHIALALKKIGFFYESKYKSLEKYLCEYCRVEKKYLGLVRTWINVLKNKEIIDQNGSCILSKNDFDDLLSDSYSSVRQLSKYRVEFLGFSSYLKRLSEYVVDLLKGQIEPIELFFDKELSFSPDYLLWGFPGVSHRNDLAQQIIKTIIKKNRSKNSQLKILQIGSRDIKIIELFVSDINFDEVSYTCTDHSTFFLNIAEEKFGDLPFIQYKIFNIDQSPQEQGYRSYEYDLIIASNTLHRAKNIELSIDYIRSLLKPGGVLLLLEMTRNSTIRYIVTGFLEKDSFDEHRKNIWEPLLSEDIWLETLQKSGFHDAMLLPRSDDPTVVFAQHLIIAQSPGRNKNLNRKMFSDFLQRKLPHYMIPDDFFLLDSFPLTSNKKVDRKKLTTEYAAVVNRSENKVIFARTSIEKGLVDIWIRLLGQDNISVLDSFFELGGDSLLATRLVVEVNNLFQVELPLINIFETPSIAELGEYIEKVRKEQPVDKELNFTPPQIVSDKKHRYDPFPLTDIQHAYWVGRSGVYSLGNVATHCYFEVENDALDMGRLDKTLQRLINHHDMMRVVMLPNGTQQVLEEVPPYQIQVTDMRGKNAQDVHVGLMEIREKMSHEVLSTDTWPLFHIHASCFNENRVRLHISFDNLIFDGWSMFHILGEWKRLYDNPEAPLPECNLFFRDYALALVDLRDSERYQRDRAYWIERFPDFPQAPDLPLAKNSVDLSEQHFCRLETRLDIVAWKQIKQMASISGLTPSVVLLTAFAEVLSYWSRRPNFVINLTQFNRLPLHPEIDGVVGDFTTLTLLTVNNSCGKTFFDRCQNLQSQLWQDMEHPYFSGVEVQRELTKFLGYSQSVVMPVVFTSALGVGGKRKNELNRKWLGDLVYNITQTPQIWLDHQVLEQDGELFLVWDFVEDLFPQGLLNDMFGEYCSLLHRLSKDELLWQEEISSTIVFPVSKQRKGINKTDSLISSETLYDLFLKQHAIAPNQFAVIVSGGCSLTYDDIFRYSCVVDELLSQAETQGTVIAVLMEKGWEQVVATLAILKAGAAYLPIDPANPKERLWHIVRDADVQIILTQSWVKERLDWPEEIDFISVDLIKYEEFSVASEPERKVNSEDLAYIIYTSGSTGLPKGVMIDHQGAVNTILDINSRFLVSSKDRILALSNLNFDLSVYDIFGSLAAGATIVMPEESKNKEPSHWLDLIKKEQISIWNTVPALMQMLVSEAESKSGTMIQSLRLVMMSGDWIPLELPERIRALAGAETDILGLGGATEASIWSCYYPIQKVDPNLASIPYGKPLANQRLYIFNHYFRECPDWVPGQLYIAGTGLAKGYWKDDKKTTASFIRHPDTGEMLYKTGDIARHRPEGYIEFLGREDFQIKIRGHRIELGEIEAVLKSHPQIEDAVVVAVAGDRKNKRLIGYVATKNLSFGSEMLDIFLKQKLPDYMVPATVIVLDTLPLTSNGKIDRQALSAPEEGIYKRTKVFLAPQTKTEMILVQIWSEMLKVDRISTNDNFFVLGGDSLLAVRFISQLRQILNVELSLKTLFNFSTIRELSQHIKMGQAEQDSSAMLLSIVPDPQNQLNPFPLTDIQQAYWIGRNRGFDLGNIATHLYFEIDNKSLDLEKLNQAWQVVIKRHGMLRAVIQSDGQQKVLREVPAYQFKVTDLRQFNSESAATALDNIRQEMSHQILPSDTWPLFDIRASLLKDGRIRLHVSWDALIADASSFFSFTNDWVRIYKNPEKELPPLNVTFRDYVLAEVALESSDKFQRAKEYWLGRLDDLPSAPELPLAKNPSSIGTPQFKRRSFTLSLEHWKILKERSQKNNLTPAGLLVSVFANILGCWSNTSQFTINLTSFNRLPLHPQINDVVGDFTSTILLRVNMLKNEQFVTRASRIQQQLWEDLTHRHFSGVRVLRELGKFHGDSKQTAMPVVFTSALNLEMMGAGSSGVNELGEMVYGISQTPQVWLDHQVYEQGGKLVLTWDAVEELFPCRMLDEMFTSYCNFLTKLANEEDIWWSSEYCFLPDIQQKKRMRVNATDASVPTETLHGLFEKRAIHSPSNTAIISSSFKFSYGEVFERMNYLAFLLKKRKVKANKLVAVFMEKGWEQVVAVLGILSSGAAYLPIDTTLPEERVYHLLDDGNIDIVLTQSWVEKKITLPEDIQILKVDEIEISEGYSEFFVPPLQSPDDLAYVIYTSGSTGIPKGVMINHRGAVNTILDINSRFELKSADRLLALSSLHFDLSVYDIFGPLFAGGAIVLPDKDKAKDPNHWLELISRHGVTVWNSVPTLMQILLEYQSIRSNANYQKLRLILLSGDWTPLDLPERVKGSFKHAQIVVLGGATESSIWSNLYVVEQINPDWKSIPYGYPMKNQKYHITNSLMMDCPDWVPGQLFIEGIGLAEGYWQDKEKTENSFVFHPKTGKRLYRTGDVGRYLPDGSIEFLGREDCQIKINGYRIEFGEIEYALRSIVGIKDATVVAVNKENKEKQLVGCVVANEKTNSPLFETVQIDSAQCIDDSWEEIIKTGKYWARVIPDAIDIQAVPEYINSLDRLSVATMLQVFVDMGIFTQKKSVYSLEQLVHIFSISSRYKTLFNQWLDVLVFENILEKTETGAYKNNCLLNDKITLFSRNIPKDLIGLSVLVKKNISTYIDLFKGNIDPVEFLAEDVSFLTAKELERRTPGREYFLKLIIETFRVILNKFLPNKNLKILEIGTRAGSLTRPLTSLLYEDRAEYTYADESLFFIEKIKNDIKDVHRFKTGLLDMNKPSVIQGYEPCSFHVIIADKTLHRSKNLDKTIFYIKSLLKPGGILLLTEPTQNNWLTLISVAFFEDGFKHIEDARKKIQKPFISVGNWKKILEKTGFEKIESFPENGLASTVFGQHFIVAQNSEKIQVLQPSRIVSVLKKKLPAYMIPNKYIVLNEIPLSSNMKVDRNSLIKLSEMSRMSSEKTYVEPSTENEVKIVNIWKKILENTFVGIRDNFFELGGDSLKAIQCLSFIKKEFHIDLSLRVFLEEATVEQLVKKIEEKTEVAEEIEMDKGVI